MSPEHGAGMKLSEASDWYSMGVMIYEALTGQLPFDPSFGSVLIQKAQEVAPPLRDFVKDIPTEFNQLCIDLLQLNPHKHPNSQQILERLDGKRITKEVRVRNILQSEIPLVGRESQLAALNEGFQAMKRGKAALLYCAGLSGIGKSTLIERFLTERKTAEPQTIVLRGRCYEHESVPYKAFDSIIDELSQYFPQNYWALLAEVQTGIYADEGNKAFQLITSQWFEMQGGLLLEGQNSVIKMVQLRVRSALAKNLTSSDKLQILRAVEKDAKILLQQKVLNSQAMAELLLAAAVAGRKDHSSTIK